jgi:transposase-like protein
MPKKKYTNQEKYDIVADYIRLGSFCAVAKERGFKGHETVRYIINKFRAERPDEYLKMQDIFLAEQRRNLLMNNERTTQKALNKVDELLDDPDSTKSVKDVAIAYGILYEKGALMKGESTSNSAIVVKLSGDLEELAK